jgi:hypothetical protein
MLADLCGGDLAPHVEIWSQVVAGLAEETDHDNFKSEVARHQGRAGAAYERSLHEVWSVMSKLQM